MLDTEADEPTRALAPVVDTLTAQDGVQEANLDDRLLHRDLKARIFGADGRVTIGRYEVRQRIGRGGMGTVYVAHDPELDRKVALKVLRADRTRGRERMLQEARALAKLAHPNVVTVHEVGLHDDRVFVAMELVEGKTLRAWLEARPSRRDLYGVFMQAARGLAAAHRAGLVHRDFKPDNVLIGDDGRVRVVDFGVAKAADSLDSLDPPSGEPRPATGVIATKGEPALTLTGQLLGTPAYMAPEQFLGASVDARTDVFAFSVTLYEALMGRRPFDGEDTAAVATSVLQGSARPLAASDVPSELVALVQQGLRREADQRPPSLDRFVAALEAAVTTGWPWQRVAKYLAVSMLGMMSLGGLSAYSLLSNKDEAPALMAEQDVPVGPLEAEGEAAAFAAIGEASDDDARLVAAEAFLERFGEGASAVRRAIAHSAAGDVQWRRSCPDAVSGLCIEELPIAAAAETCSTPRRGSIRQQPRTAVLSEPAQRHLRAAVALAGVSVSSQDPAQPAFAEAIARARVQLADAELEGYLTLDVPAELDFHDAKVLSESAFVQFYTQLSGNGHRLLQSYAEVKQPGDVRWTLVAAARSGMVSETAAASMARTPVPARLAAAEREAYCGALEEHRAEPTKMVRAMYTYCVDKAEKHDLAAEPIVAFCRARLELYPEA